VDKTGIATVDYMGCFDCNLIFQKIPLDPSYYKRDYRRILRTGNIDPTPGNLVGEHRRAVRLLVFLKEHNIKPKRILDVGCSTGLILRELQKEFGCEVVGVEPGDAFRMYGIGQGTTIYDNIDKITDKFDFVTTTHVLEHQTEPIKFLNQIIERMSGYVFIEVPLLNPALPHHLMFTADTFKDMVTRAGIKIVDRTVTDPLQILGRV
jgi:2-polyprenyl-3-methyl-5-hydroxy-6-metoxy-1,4-benzoquinol methylase